MIQSAAPNTASAISQVSGLLSGQPAENGTPGTESGSFAQVLAEREAPDPAAGQGAAAAEPAEPDIAPLAAAQPNLAASLPLTGKILPGLLPDAGNPAEPGPEADTGAPGQAVPGLLAALRALRVPQQEAAAPKTANRSGQAPVDPLDHADDGETDPTTPVAAGFAAQAGLALALPTTPGAASDPAASTLPPMIEAQLLGRPLPQRDAALTGAQSGAQPTAAAKTQATDPALALRLDPARIDPQAAGEIRFEAGSARPMTGVQLRPELTGEAEAKLSPIAPATDAASLLANPLNQAASLAAPVPTQAAPHMAQPHDFAALMDRLIAARDAAQTGLPQSVQVAVNHAEFGQVSLSFQHDQRGLAVSVASADPDFARAVQAAIPAANAAASADAGSRDNGQGSGNAASGWNAPGFGRGDASPSGGDSAARQGRSAQFDPDAPLPAASRRAEARDSTPSQSRGIFA